MPHDLPARAVLAAEQVFVMSDDRAGHQDIRPMRIAILNLMPMKVTTETQLLRLLSNSPLQIELTLLRMASHVSRTTASEHLDSFYSTFDDVAEQHFDGLIITGALAIVAFIIMAAVVYFGVIKPYQAMRERFVAAEEETTDESVELLREIRDSLRAGRA